jgi:mono/diheme cytochrome c family protein
MGSVENVRKVGSVKRVITLVLLSMGAVFFSVSCARETQIAHQEMEHGTPPGWTFTLPEGDPVSGRQLFVEAECYKCHEIKGEVFPGVAPEDKGIGPELSGMGGLHPVEFFAESIINPNAVIDHDAAEKGYLTEDGRSRMPDFSDVFTVQQVADLAAYLNSLKPAPGHPGH